MKASITYDPKLRKPVIELIAECESDDLAMQLLAYSKKFQVDFYLGSVKHEKPFVNLGELKSISG